MISKSLGFNVRNDEVQQTAKPEIKSTTILNILGDIVDLIEITNSYVSQSDSF
jgi:hypothetical protein